MKLRRRFYDSVFKFGSISRRRYVVSILIGLISAFLIYSGMYLIREVFRNLTFGFGYLPNILSDSERFIFNWFLAALSLIFGNSIAISLLFSGIQGGFGTRNIKKRRVVSDQTGLNTFFLFWFTKVCLAISFFSMGFTDFNFIPSFTLFLILLILVLYLETWKTLITVIRKKKHYKMLTHFIVFIVFSFSLSQIELIDYKKINERQLRFRPLIDLPKSNFENVVYYDNYLDIYLKRNEKTIQFGYYENNINESHLDFLDYKTNLYGGFVQDVSIRLSADKRTKMDLIKSVEKKIVQAEINNIIYATQEKDVRARRFSNNGIKLRLKSNRLIENNKENIHFGIRNTYYDIENSLIANDTVVLEIGSKIKMDGVEMDRKMLVTDFKNEIKKNKVFKYLYSNDLEFNDYIYVLSTHLKAVNLLCLAY